MFLKSIEIFGFKSFADRTKIEFSDGITALVGPNGCGKSNVVDALKWVLAESRSKNLRAEKMEDVIFSGTERRAALNVAEVTLTIDNEKKILPMEEPEIQIRRRLFRNGENEFFLNGQQTGPSAIRRLFLDTGVGKASYSVMEQGKVTQLLETKPEDRRYLFEEAAGISRSKEQCAEAERALERTRANLQTIEAALAEIRRIYDTLKAQSEKTEAFRNLKDEIFSLELDIQLLKLKGFIQDKARAEAELKKADEERMAAKAEIDAAASTLSENMDRQKEMQDKVHSLQNELIKVGGEQNLKKQQEKQLLQKKSEISAKIGQIEARKSQVQENVDSLNEEIDSAEAELHEKAKQLELITGNIVSFKKEIDEAAAQIQANGRRAEEAAQKISALEGERAALQKELESITEDIVTELDEKLREAGYSSAACRKAKDALDERLQKLKILARGRRDVFGDFAARSGHTEAESGEMARAAVAAFDEAEELARQIEDALSDYVKASPAFIDEFLSPQGIITRKRSIDEKISGADERKARIQQEIEDLRGQNGLLSEKIDGCRETLGKLQMNKVQMETQIDSGRQQIGLLKRSLTAEQNALRQLDDELFSEQKAADESAELLEEVQGELSEIEFKGRKIADELRELDEKIASGAQDLSGKQELLQKKQREYAAWQEQYERQARRIEMAEVEIKGVKQNFIDTHSRDLMEFEERMYKLTSSPSELRERLAKSRESLRSLGQVNLMAPEEFQEVRDRFERQSESYADTQKSLEELERVSEEIRAKSTELFLEAYNTIKKNFHNMFRRLFGGGGRAELRLTDPRNVLSSGIEIYAQPPGKKFVQLSSLSGGEKTMTAVALLFATFQVRSSPFCLLDEIDAALDDKNISSFVTALKSFSAASQYIMITHNKKSVAGASSMLGVTMEEAGISKVISVRLDETVKSEADYDDDKTEEFIEEDVPPEEGAVIPPRPQPRIHNEDGTVTDPEAERFARIARQKEEAAKAREEGKKNTEGVPDAQSD